MKDYQAVYESTAGTQEEKVRAVFREYATPRNRWFYSRTYRTVILRALDASNSIPLLFTLISGAFVGETRNQINPRGDFAAAINALQICMRALDVQTTPNNKPYISLLERRTVQSPIQPEVRVKRSIQVYEDPIKQSNFNAVVGNFAWQIQSPDFTLVKYDALALKVKGLGFDIFDVVMSGLLLHKVILTQARYCDLELIERLVIDGNGQNVNLQDERGNTPVLKATLLNRMEIAQKLVELGADIQIKNQEGIAASRYLSVTPKTPDVMRRMHSRDFGEAELRRSQER